MGQLDDNLKINFAYLTSSQNCFEAYQAIIHK